MYTKEKLLEIIGAYEEQHKKIPTQRELRRFGVTDDPFRRVFGSYSAGINAYEKGLGKEWRGECADRLVPPEKPDKLLEALRANLSDAELKAMVASSGGSASKPKLKHAPYETGYMKFLVMTDTHIGHKKFREDWFHHMVDRATKEKVDFAFHVGDILEGMSTRPGHVYELDQIGFEAQFAEAKRLLGSCPFEIKGIIGNHDEWYIGKADQGTNVGLRLEESLDNFTYLGSHEADIEIENVKIKLWHGNDGSSYAVSYRGQKIVESLDGGDKPHILITGHDHKAIFFQTRNVHIIGGGTLCEQTGFMRGKKLAAHKGYWIVEVWSNEQGLVRIRPEWCPFY